MRLLLDTHIALWLLRDAPELSPAARQQIDAAKEIYVSSASIWEATIKARLGKLPLNPARLVSQLQADGVLPLAVTWEHARAVHDLPDLHRDPFDRLLLAQSQVEPLHLLTHDALLARYSPLVIRV